MYDSEVAIRFNLNFVANVDAIVSVVDKDYKVYGVEGLRVMDGSTFFESPGRYQGIKILKEKSDAGAFNTQQQRPEEILIQYVLAD
ncbi:(r)-mandelonitrile lyase 1 [Quercus suber]|uniref:(R)-mandelonitrile lyase 1 n=1 Tax=Quercus suber TaxID=58331 RepID=A0AAW0LJV8_QUESU